MNLANRITLFRILLIPVFIALFPIYPEALISKSVILQHPDRRFSAKDSSLS
ncbi:hypothetical protein [Paenibacillus sp. FSL R10-2736]|uniref:hypothetical protein n=1 Tax=Paenibacillus sp. FSL R10-2736 TaxID=2954692 RepID=UPI0030FA50A2